MNSFIVTDISGLYPVAESLISICRENNYPIIAFYGKMGAGKTTLIKVICEIMGVDEVVSSPTFSLVNEYHTGDDEIIYHFDFYRINDISEAYDFGYEEYFYSDNFCFIEWPEKIEELLPDNTFSVNILTLADGSRQINF